MKLSLFAARHWVLAVCAPLLVGASGRLFPSRGTLRDVPPRELLGVMQEDLARSEGPAGHGASEQEEPALLQVEAERVEQASIAAGPLFAVNVVHDWKTHDPAEGVTISMDTAMKSLKVDAGMKPDVGIAWARLTDKLSETGWMEMFVQTSPSARVTNDVRMYAAGFLEGLISAVRMSQFYSNFYQILVPNENAARTLNNIRRVCKDELEFVRQNSNLHAGAMSMEPADPYWKHARYIYLQMWGIKDGYNFVALAKKVRQLDMIDMMLINKHAELPELMEIYSPDRMRSRQLFQAKASQAGALLQKGPAVSLRGARAAGGRSQNSTLNHSQTPPWLANLTDRDWEERLAKRGHCSALVRVAPENKDLFVGHTTWSDYSQMTRVFKYYTFQLPGAYTAAKVMAFSSYPGCVSSTDDFYMLSSGLAILNTNLEILNPTLYDRVPEFPANSHLPNFLHIMTVNRMARTGAMWTSLFTERNGGTNNAQWMIVDYNRFLPGVNIQGNTLWLLEQVPGFIHKQDISSLLSGNGYWASYNRPYFEDTRRMTGHTAAEQKHGDLFSYGNSPRALIFKRSAVGISNMFGVRSIMNRNTFPNEGVFPSEPGHAISARLDLDKVSHLPNGGIDAKVTSRCLFRSLQCQAISGPTHASQPVFVWSEGGQEAFPGWPHKGLPNAWGFNWVQMTPSKLMTRIVDGPEDEC